MAVESALGQAQFLHDPADAVHFSPVLPERSCGRREDLLVGLGFLLRRVPHTHEITQVILKMQDIFGRFCTGRRLRLTHNAHPLIWPAVLRLDGRHTRKTGDYVMGTTPGDSPSVYLGFNCSAS